MRAGRLVCAAVAAAVAALTLDIGTAGAGPPITIPGGPPAEVVECQRLYKLTAKYRKARRQMEPVCGPILRADIKRRTLPR